MKIRTRNSKSLAEFNFFIFFILFKICVYGCLAACVSVPDVQLRVSDLLELEKQMAVSHCVGVSN